MIWTSTGIDEMNSRMDNLSPFTSLHNIHIVRKASEIEPALNLISARSASDAGE